MDFVLGRFFKGREPRMNANEREFLYQAQIKLNLSVHPGPCICMWNMHGRGLASFYSRRRKAASKAFFTAEAQRRRETSLCASAPLRFNLDCAVAANLIVRAITHVASPRLIKSAPEARGQTPAFAGVECFVLEGI